MFSNRTVNPSPNRTSIKEANDHLQLLHQRVMDLETTTREQSEALKKKDELLQTTIRDITDLKDAEIHDLASIIDQLRDRVKKLEHLLREKDQQIELLNHRCSIAEDVATYTPAVEKLLSAMKKLPYKAVKHGTSRQKNRPVRSHNLKADKKQTLDGSHSHDLNSVDGHVSLPNQSFADLRIGRSFNINSNFSLSEDE
ncbi:Vimentin-type intermediate filament-associated coiled-coil protein, partial [Stegodyphus mimosarum]